jgi:siroheme synthase
MFGYAEERAGAALIAAGKPPATPIANVENAARPQLSVAYGTLARLPRLGCGPVLILIGEVYREAAAADRAARNFRQASA